MPDEYGCSSCELSFSVGSYHGEEEEWYAALYCRHCGADYLLRKSSEQFLSSRNSGRKEYDLAGQHIVVISGGEVPKVRCVSCGAEEPFGGGGPITDETPAGLPEPSLFSTHGNPKACGTCPRCKNQTLTLESSWIT